MQCRPARIFPLVAACAGLVGAALTLAAPAQADPTEDPFVTALTDAAISAGSPADAVALGQSICPMLSEQGQTAADAASTVADATGMSLGGANLFTGIAVAMFCPAMVSSIGNGASPVLSILGF